MTKDEDREAALRESEERYRTMIESSSEVISTLDSEGVFLYMNHAAAAGLGGKPEDFIGKTLWDCFPKNADRHFANIRQVIDTGKELSRKSDVVLKGQAHMFQTIIRPLPSASGGVSQAMVTARDITEEHHLAQQLAEQRANLADVFEQSPIAIEQYDADGRLVNANQACLDLFGIASLDDVLGFDLFKDVTLAPERKRQLANGEIVHYEHDFSFERVREQHLYKTSKRGVIRLSVTISPLRRSHSGLSGYLLHVQDITKREKADAALRRSESMLAEAQRITHLGSWDWDCVNDVLIWSDETYRIFGFEPGSVENLNAEFFFSMMHPDDLSHVKEAIHSFLYEKAPYDIEHRIIRPDGTQRIINERAACFYDEHDQPIRTIGTAFDITERKQAEEEVQRSETKFRTLYDSSSDAVMLLDRKSFFDCNDATVRIFGCRDKAEFCSLHPSDVSPARQPCGTDSLTLANQRIDTAFANGSNRFEWMHKRRDTGEDFPAEVLLNAMELDGRQVLQAVVRDITERKEAEAEAVWYQDRLRSLAMELSLAEERERKRLAVALHDDLVQLLSVARMRLTLLDGLATKPAATECLAETAQLVDRAVRFTRSLMLQLSHPALYEMGLVAATEWLVEDMQELHNLKVGLSGFQDADPLDQRTRVVLFQCMRELLVNVAKHAGANSAIVRITREDQMVRVTVKDDGIGFDVEEGRLRGDGTQFGLFSIQERISMLGGQVAIRSAPGEGTTVAVEVPIAAPGDTISEGTTP